MFRAERITKTFRGGVTANHEIDLSIAPGEVHGLLGPAGSGKTTFLRQIVGLLRPTSGSLRLQGHDLIANPAIARRLCSYLPQSQIPVGSFRVREAIELIARIRGTRRDEARRETDRLIAALDLDRCRNSLVINQPSDVKRLVGFAMAAVRPGALVLLDEPAADLDADQLSLLGKEIDRFRQAGCAVLIAADSTPSLEQLADRLSIVDSGRIVSESAA